MKVFPLYIINILKWALLLITVKCLNIYVKLLNYLYQIQITMQIHVTKIIYDVNGFT